MTFAEIWKGIGTGAAIYGEDEDATGACAVRSWRLYYVVLFNVGLRSGVTMRAAAAIFMLTIVAWIVVTTPQVWVLGAFVVTYLRGLIFG